VEFRPKKLQDPVTMCEKSEVYKCLRTRVNELFLPVRAVRLAVLCAMSVCRVCTAILGSGNVSCSSSFGSTLPSLSNHVFAGLITLALRGDLMGSLKKSLSLDG